MIEIKKSETADTRSCDFKNVSKTELLASSVSHIGDVIEGIDFFISLLNDAAKRHDYDKITKIDNFHSNFITGFEERDWLDNHIILNRHHLEDENGIPNDVNLIDVLEMISDCVMAGMARSGSVYPFENMESLLVKAFNNTVSLLKEQIVVIKEKEKNDNNRKNNRRIKKI
jgi:hypothetical protein